MRYYPVFLDLKNKKCVVIGGGSVAERKAVTLLSCKADICVISPDITSRLRELAKKKKLRYIKKRYEDKDIKDAFLVVAATNNRDANKAVFAAAKKYKCLLNSVSSEKARRQIFTKLAKSNIINLLKKGNRKEFYREIENILRMR